MKGKAKSIGSAIGTLMREICYLLTIVFCVLRACDVIDWNWFWIMSPIFITFIIAVVIWVIVGLITCIALSADDEKGKSSSKRQGSKRLNY